MTKPNFIAASEQISDLFDFDSNPSRILKISNYIVDESRRGHYLLMGIVPDYLSLNEILATDTNDFRGSNELERNMDMFELRQTILNNFEKNRNENKNSMCCVYFKQHTYPHEPLFFVQLCVPLGKNAVAVLNRRKNYVYVGKYHSKLEDVLEYSNAIKELQENKRFLTYRTVTNMRIYSKQIFMYLMDRHNEINSK